MTGNLALLGLLAFVSGGLFRAYAATGIPVLRMFGTMGIALAGIVAGMALTQGQTEAARAEVRRQLQGLGRDFRVVPASGGYLVVAPSGLFLLRFEAMANYGRGLRAQRRLQQALAAALAAASALRHRLGSAGFAGTSVTPALLLLRRSAATAAELLTRSSNGAAVAVGDPGGGAQPQVRSPGGGVEPQVLLLNPDSLVQALTNRSTPGLLDEDQRRRLAEALLAEAMARRSPFRSAKGVAHVPFH